jgi:hypothetical protein
MQRVRIGLTGLAFVFLAVLLAAIFTGRPSMQPPITQNSLDRQKAGAPAAPAPPPTAPSEPLAQLGVAPGNPDANGTGAQPAPAPAH